MRKLLLLIGFIGLCHAALAAGEAAAPASNNSKQPISVDADTLEVFQDQQKAVFSGNVAAKQGTATIKADKMTIYYLDKQSAATTPAPAKAPAGKSTAGDVTGGKNSIKKIDFDGNVFMTNPEEAARSKKGSYDPQKHFITLTDDVELVKGNDILKGNQLDYNMDTGYSKLYTLPTQTGQKRVSGLFIPNADDQTPAPAAATNTTK